MGRNVAFKVLRGTQANRPALSDGEFYLAEDTQILFLGTNFGVIRFNASPSIAFVSGGGAASVSGGTSLSPASGFKTGNTGVVGIALKTTTVSVSSITDGFGSVFTRQTAFNNSTSVRVELWSTAAGGILGNSSNVTVSFTGGSSNAVAVASQYSGVVAIGAANSGSGSSANPIAAGTTQDPNNFLVAMFAGLGTNAFSAGTQGSLRGSFNMSGSNAVGGAIADNTSFSAGTVNASVTDADTTWALATLELRTV